MRNHAPARYQCPFCLVAAGREDERIAITRREDVVRRHTHATAFIASHWWPNNPGHVIVVPNRNIENIYGLVPEISVHVHEMSRQIAIALVHVYNCPGTSLRQHNEPEGHQDVWHYHLHVFPRYTNDHLYYLTDKKTLAPASERASYAQKLRAYFESESNSA